MNRLSFNKTNPNLTVIPFKENKCTSSETQTWEEGRKKKEKESYPDVKKEERKRGKKKKREKRKDLPRCEERKKKKEKKKNKKELPR